MFFEVKVKEENGAKPSGETTFKTIAFIVEADEPEEATEITRKQYESLSLEYSIENVTKKPNIFDCILKKTK